MSKHIRKVLGLLQHRKQIPPPHQQPTSRIPEEWSTYWKAQGQPWRTEPEIDKKRQEYLAKRRSIESDAENSIYPFKDIKLSRADVEWMLATHESEGICGPVEWSENSQRGGEGLDLRGADLRGADLSLLPLARLRGGPTLGERSLTALAEAFDLRDRHKRDAIAVQMERTILFGARLQGANLSHAQLQRANLGMARLQKADLTNAQLQGAILINAELEGADLREAQLQRAYLSGAFLDNTTKLAGIILADDKNGSAFLGDIRWGGTNLAGVDWASVKMLFSEQEACQPKRSNGETKKGTAHLEQYRSAVRANRQLATVLRDQGMNEEADRFAYRAQVLQREVWRRQHRYLKYVGSWFLWLLAGHGYRPLRSILWYLAIIIGFALTYYTFGHLSLWPPDAFIYSLTSFHGRGFFPGLEGKHSLHDPLIMLAALEAVVGLFIEISFIATFTQRFFGK